LSVAARGEEEEAMGEIGPELMKYFPESVETDPAVYSIPRPVNHKCFAFDLIDVEKSPEPAVLTVLAVIAHHEQMFRGNDNGSEIVAWDESIILWRFGVPNVFFFIKLVVYINFLSPDLKNISGYPDHTFDEITAFIFWVFENDDLTSFWDLLEQNDVIKKFDV
jgi:hypothetical protein